MSRPERSIAVLTMIDGSVWEIARSEVPLGASITGTLGRKIAHEGKPVAARLVEDRHGAGRTRGPFALTWFARSSVVSIEAAQ